MNLSFVFFTLFIIIISTANTMAQMINGQVVRDNGFKYQALLLKDGGKCSGSIIDEYHIVTAAHCVDDVRNCELIVYVGITDIADSTKVMRSVRDIHVHPRFTPRMSNFTEHLGIQQLSQLEYDIAVLTLTYPLQFGEAIGTIALPTSDVTYCQTCFTAGWGRTEAIDGSVTTQLRWIAMITAIPAFCIDAKVYHGANEFCAYDPLQLTSPSHGDSGSALRCGNELTGIVSYGWSRPEVPVIFTNVFKHLNFINKIINLMSECAS